MGQLCGSGCRVSGESRIKFCAVSEYKTCRLTSTVTKSHIARGKPTNFDLMWRSISDHFQITRKSIPCSPVVFAKWNYCRDRHQGNACCMPFCRQWIPEALLIVSMTLHDHTRRFLSLNLIVNTRYYQ